MSPAVSSHSSASNQPQRRQRGGWETTAGRWTWPRTREEVTRLRHEATGLTFERAVHGRINDQLAAEPTGGVPVSAVRDDSDDRRVAAGDRLAVRVGVGGIAAVVLADSSATRVRQRNGALHGGPGLPVPLRILRDPRHIRIGHAHGGVDIGVGWGVGRM